METVGNCEQHVHMDVAEWRMLSMIPFNTEKVVPAFKESPEKNGTVRWNFSYPCTRKSEYAVYNYFKVIGCHTYLLSCMVGLGWLCRPQPLKAKILPVRGW